MKLQPIHILAVLAVLAVLPWFLGNAYIFHICTMIVIMIPMAMGMNLMLKAGHMSIAMPAFMGIGAYSCALLAMRLHWSTPLALCSGAVLAALAAGIVGPIFLRIKGVYFVLLTYAFSQVIDLVFQEWTSLFGGNSGLYGIPKLSLFGLRLTMVQQYYVLGLCVAAVFYSIMRFIEISDIGAILDSFNANEMLGLSMGGNALSWRTAAFVLSALAAGFSGGIYAFYIGFLSPEAFGFHLSIDLIVINAIGGVRSVLGPLLGSVLIVPLPELLREARQYQLLIYGVCLIVFLLFMRNGLVSLILRKKEATR